MIQFSPVQPDEMLRRHAKARARPAAATKTSAPIDRARNLEPILSLGDLDYVHFRGRAYGVPPLPWKEGQRISNAQARAINAITLLSQKPTDDKTRAEYYKALGQLPDLLWRNCRPTGYFRRAWANGLFRFLRLAANPFDGATDRELLELTDFFSSRRMRSGDQPPTVAMPRRRSATSSTS